ncbi:MAG: transcription-repair coupling factor [Oscillospiraceae bacterium]|nr:transcription-repair coupling factor [Oscillospiraceae bacterium]
MNFLNGLLSGSAAFSALTDALRKGNTPISLSGASDIHKAHIVSAAADTLGGKNLLVCRNESIGRQLCRDINAFSGRETAVFYPERDLCFSLSQTSSREYEQERLSALFKILTGAASVLVSPVSAALQFSVKPETLKKSCFTLKSGDIVSIDSLTASLVSGGYVRRNQVDGVGQFSVRGGIIDVFCPSHKKPVRIELWDDEIDSISPFDLDTQRREESIPSVTVTPSREALFSIEDLKERLGSVLKKCADTPSGKTLASDLALLESGEDTCLDKYLALASEKGSIFDFIDSAVFVSEMSDLVEAAKGFNERLQLQVSDLVSSGELISLKGSWVISEGEFIDKIAASSCVLMDTFARNFPLIQPKKFITVRASQSGLFSQKPSSLSGQLSRQLADGFIAVIAVPTEHLAGVLCSDLKKEGLSVVTVSALSEAELVGGTVYVTAASFSACFEYPDEKVTFISFAGEKTSAQAKKKKSKAVFDLSSVSIGDYVVHSAHGIGIYKGIQKLTVQGVIKDYIKIQYGGSDVLYVPVTQLDMVAKYIGASADDTLKLSRLNSVSWANTKRKVSRAVRDMAEELTALYAKRMQAKGFAFSEDTDWQHDFEARFPYTETPDQIRCIEEIKRDMQSQTPMDRVLCGDVGFGKTEVALRAAMKCVMDSKQCAILVPTTILAWQHYKTALARFDSFPINIALLSGFRSTREQQEILKKLKKGEIDIVIGTHRLVQKDIEFKNLGLAIIDEEQRFGVKHKEKFKELYAGVDMLTLSATPIPRTLNMAMSGIRDISMIEEAPLDRYPVQTFVMEYNRRLLLDAIERELARGGQVYYLHNRIETIDQKAAALAQAIPGARVAAAHGALSATDLENIWKKLVDHEIDILVCTTIIETGVDVANCNTMIIEDADRMGLSQLYQLRGRIGRSSRRAYAYFTFRPGKEVSEVAAKRLSAIRDFTAFGSGFQIALRDLEIRGAGNMLGAQQHGHMDAVGYDMYLKLLNQAIAEQKGEEIMPEDNDCLIDLPISAHIPNSYIEDNVQRIEIYRQIASLENDEDAMELVDELIDRWGEPPVEVSLLISVALLRSAAIKAGITQISQKSDFVLIEFKDPSLPILAAACSEFSRSVFLSNSSIPYLSVKIQNKKDMVSHLTDIAQFLSEQTKKDVKN